MLEGIGGCCRLLKVGCCRMLLLGTEGCCRLLKVVGSLISEVVEGCWMF